MADFLLSKRQELLFAEEKEEIKRLIKEASQLKHLYMRWGKKEEDNVRVMGVPNKKFRPLCDRIADYIKSQRKHSSCHGGEKGWSTKKSLITHLPCKSVLSFDIKSASQNTPFVLIQDFFYERLNYLEEEIRVYVSNKLVGMLIVKYSNDQVGLPQGSPHSLPLFNRMLYPYDESLAKRAAERGMTYSRWNDDFTISSKEKKPVEEFLGAIDLISEDFPISENKTFFQQAPDDIYLLGHIIKGNEIIKNTREKVKQNKGNPINILDYEYARWN
jgi:hypothetical protein